ncbi:NAD(P)/FAD-dependent oxidoreductase [Tabrizicola sp.]|uniref:NAD(P)/FAD-dependent oxidoreductase n=1 Tax=Tabrizicola sp. TaxID=2005166 RepID=UPI002624AE29|nr:NAD(P)/FAD-dependent oxidoreductase [Tabrizicola sp.]MDM7933664.1 NAD(P)/FAD-dependent oxidoreductase [Tabrizicola sp.]
MSQKHFDVLVIGGGVVGCAMARHFTLAGASVALLEKAPDVLDGASKGNSAILHTGFDAPPDSLELACIQRGHALYLRDHAGLQLPILRTGALVLAWNAEQMAKLPALIAKGQANGVSDIRMLSRAQILAREPHLSETVVGGFEVPGEVVIDPWTTAHVYLLQAMANGATLLRSAEVLSGDFDGAHWRLRTSADEITGKQVINCAGLYGDIVDTALLGESTFFIRPRKGQFLVFDKAASRLSSSILLPVPTDKTKGIVICPTIFGNLLVGPTAEDQDSRTDASTDRETLESLRMTGKRMLPGLASFEVTAAYAGLRPACAAPGYQVRRVPDMNYVSVGAIRSTGLSAALGLAEQVAEMLGRGDHVPMIDPQMPEVERLSDYHGRDWQEPGYGEIVCHCERVTRREIDRVLAGPMPPRSLQGLKRRTRVCMGRCQGFYCRGTVAQICGDRLDMPQEDAA